MPFTEAQQWALVIAPKITGLISLVFSGLVIFTVCVCEKRRARTYHRLLLGISCVDASSSFWLGLSTWPIPEGTGIKWASGNTGTCTTQGFFTQFGIASSFYNASLSIFYLLVIRYGWKEEAILKLEPWLHTMPLLWGLWTAIAGLPLTIFNSANLWCWIAQYDDRGAHADLFRWVFFYGPLWIMILLVTINVLLIFQHVRTLEKATAQYQDHNGIQYRGDLGTVESTAKEEHDSASRDGTPANEPSDSSDSEDDNGEGGGANKAKKDCSREVKPFTQSPPYEFSKVLSSKMLSLRMMSLRNSTIPERSNQQRQRRMRRSRDVANQCVRFAGSFYFTWTALSVS